MDGGESKNTKFGYVAELVTASMSFVLTFFSDSIHLLIAITDEPVRSFIARMDSLMRMMVAMVN